ncbi:MFS transporter, partial [Burkholderia contaminans]
AGGGVAGAGGGRGGGGGGRVGGGRAGAGPGKAALQLLLAVFRCGDVWCGTASGYAVLMVARVVTSFAHGSFFGIGAVVAASLVPADKRASAIALMFTGLTLSNVLGVPLGTALRQVPSWPQPATLSPPPRAPAPRTPPPPRPAAPPPRHPPATPRP